MRLLPERKKRTPHEIQLDLLKKELKKAKTANNKKKMIKTFRSAMEKTAIHPKDKEQQLEWMFGSQYMNKTLGRRSSTDNMRRGGK